MSAIARGLSPDALAATARERQQAGEALIARGELAAALDVLREELELRRHLVERDPDDADKRAQVARTSARVAEVLVFRSAITALRQGVNAGCGLGSLAAKEPARQHDISWTLSSAGRTLAAQGDAAGALALHREGLTIRRELAAREPRNGKLQLDVSWSLGSIADILDATGACEDALVALRESLAIRRVLAAADPGNDGLQCDLAASLVRIAEVLTGMGDRAGALGAYGEARDIVSALSAREPEVAARREDLAALDERIAALGAPA